ncbi:hypothetical protein [Listeria seeligeri]|uniref:hypothetical protein n=1 Tax=Listeria seeligeri TaxID=1640 RepID=UPI0010B67EB5|nr:hypothetical protein [Listeria seeligeri]EAC2922377.1 hypothetical protein [Listeria monocytogenes]MBC1557020.1 hypothetical protein [Listeria seeligeri]HAB0718290.1 hypothetical protein [Listeria monocytogenes]
MFDVILTVSVIVFALHSIEKNMKWHNRISYILANAIIIASTYKLLQNFTDVEVFSKSIYISTVAISLYFVHWLIGYVFPEETD